MRLRILSDLHAELYPFTPPELEDRAAPKGKDLQDVVVLAGDIHSGPQAVAWAKTTFPDVPVILVPGNHEYYNSNLSRTAVQMKWAAEDTNVRLLDNASVVIEGTRYIGTTLWTDFALFGDGENRAYAMSMAKRCMLDFNCITYGSTGWFRPQQSVQLHRVAVEWLEKELAKPFAGPTVVVTHHAPHFKSVAPRYAKDILTAAFVSDLSRLVGKARLWIHGHTHDAFDYEVASTRVICNPRGYFREDTGFDPMKVVEI